MDGMGLWYDKEARTNNEAEVRALLAGLEFLEANPELLGSEQEVIVYGDSLLVINCMLGIYRAKTPFLYKHISTCKKLVKRMKPKFHFLHIKRKVNAVPDWLA